MIPEQWLLTKDFYNQKGDIFVWRIWDYFVQVNVTTKSLVSGRDDGSRMQQSYKDFDDMKLKIQREVQAIELAISQRVRYITSKLWND